MKKSVILGTIGLTLFLTGCGQATQRLSYIGAEYAKGLVVKAAGVEEQQIATVKTDLNTKNGVDYYLVELTIGDNTYQYDVDALTGKILERRPVAEETEKMEQKASQEAKEQKVSQEAKEQKTKQEVTAQKVQQEEKKQEEKPQVEKKEEVKKEEAKKESSKETAQQKPVENKQPVKENSSSQSAISEAKAKEIALAQVPGATLSDIKEFEIDHDDGRLEYEGKIYYDHKEYEFEIDGYSGAIRDWDVESIYD